MLLNNGSQPARSATSISLGILGALCWLSLQPGLAAAQSQAFSVEASEFLVSVSDGQGSQRTIEASQVPFLPDRACFGWRLKLAGAPPVVRYREVLQLPAAPAFWSGEDDAYSPHRYSADRTTATTEEFAALDEGWFGSSWCLSAGDPLGPHSIEVYIGERLAKRFEFEVRKP